jgi:hypothetical protein
MYKLTSLYCVQIVFIYKSQLTVQITEEFSEGELDGMTSLKQHLNTKQIKIKGTVRPRFDQLESGNIAEISNRCKPSSKHKI